MPINKSSIQEIENFIKDYLKNNKNESIDDLLTNVKYRIDLANQMNKIFLESPQPKNIWNVAWKNAQKKGIVTSTEASLQEQFKTINESPLLKTLNSQKSQRRRSPS